MFWVPSHKAVPALFIWQDFMDALREVGFKAEELFGSVWIVYQPNGNATLFQEPQLDPTSKRTKVPFATARNYGRRLQLRFNLGPNQIQLKKHNASETSVGDEDGAKKSSEKKKEKKK
jgi:hypothetical protein